jgi:hypothetical protein
MVKKVNKTRQINHPHSISPALKVKITPLSSSSLDWLPEDEEITNWKAPLKLAGY